MLNFPCERTLGHSIPFGDDARCWRSAGGLDLHSRIYFHFQLIFEFRQWRAARALKKAATASPGLKLGHPVFKMNQLDGLDFSVRVLAGKTGDPIFLQNAPETNSHQASLSGRHV
ncbi:MAG: hypothetical protein ACX939_08940 [Hyphococcus sp.]